MAGGHVEVDDWVAWIGDGVNGEWKKRKDMRWGIGVELNGRMLLI